MSRWSASARRRRRVTVAVRLVVLAGAAVALRSALATSDTPSGAPPNAATANLTGATGDVAPTGGQPPAMQSVVGARGAGLEVVASSGALVRSGPIGRRELLRRLFTSDALEAQVDELDHETDVIASRLGVSPIALTWIEQPLSARAEPTPTGVRVLVWSTVVFGTDRPATAGRAASVPTVMWRTSVVDLVWRESRWQVTAMTATPGPTPSLDDAPAPDGFARFREVASWPAVVAGVER